MTRGYDSYAFLSFAVMAETAISLDQLAGIEKIKQYLSDKGLDLPSDPNDIQAEWSVPFMRWVAANTTAGIEATIQPVDEPGIRLGTHRDIVCDPALYNMARAKSLEDKPPSK